MAQAARQETRHDQDGPPGQPGRAGEKALGELVSELWELIRAYVRQEAVDPIKGLGRYLALGTLGALLVGMGVLLLALGGLRALQTETGSNFTGSLSWIPYLIAFVVLAAGTGLALVAATRRGTRDRGG